MAAKKVKKEMSIEAALWGLDSEELILKVNTGDVSGIKDYTIDQIKYINSTEIKDVILAGLEYNE